MHTNKTGAWKINMTNILKAKKLKYFTQVFSYITYSFNAWQMILNSFKFETSLKRTKCKERVRRTRCETIE